MDEMKKRIEIYLKRLSETLKKNPPLQNLNEELSKLTSTIEIDAVDIPDRVTIASEALSELSEEQRLQLAKELIYEQIVKQRNLLTHWSTITAQSAMIDSGYIAQHLVSLCTCIAGQGMRGKGLDLSDGSEVKSANFIDSKDKKGNTNPRWDFNTREESLKDFLHYSFIYLVSIDYSVKNDYRIRIWKVDVQKHNTLRKRYREWMKNPDRGSTNFQLFPPSSGTDDYDARHGFNRKGSLPPVKIALENVNGAEKIFHAEIINDEVVVSVFEG